MSTNVPHIFAPLPGPIPLSYLDDNFLALRNTTLTSVAALRALTISGPGSTFLTGYYAAGDGGGGEYFYNSSDTTSADNGGTIIVAADGGRWYLSTTTWVSIRQFGATGNGTTDDTASINACFAWAQGAGKSVFAPSGNYLVTNLVYGSQSVVGQSATPTGLFGEGLSTTFTQKSGATGTVLAALGVGGTQWQGFTVTASGNANQCIDTSYGVNGPSLHNDFHFIRCTASSIIAANGAIWKATNNNDCSFQHIWCIGVNASVSNQIGLDFSCAGGSNDLNEVYCVNSYLRIGVQNGTVRGGWFFGVMLASGCINNLRFAGCQFFENATLLTHIGSQSFASFQSAHYLALDNCWFIMGGTITSIINANLYSTVDMNGCNFTTVNSAGPVNLLGTLTRSDSLATVKVNINGGQGDSIILNDIAGGTVVTIAKNFMSNATGLNFNKKWAGTGTPIISGSTVAGAGTYTTQTMEWYRDNDWMTVYVQIVWTAHTGTGSMLISGFPALPETLYIAVGVCSVSTFGASTVQFNTSGAGTVQTAGVSQAMAGTGTLRFTLSYPCIP